MRNQAASYLSFHMFVLDVEAILVAWQRVVAERAEGGDCIAARTNIERNRKVMLV